jgi:hypothetical protein
VGGSRLWARTYRIVRGAVAASICLVAHIFLYETVIWSAGAPEHSPGDLPARISVASESDQETMQWIALDPQALTDASRPKLNLPTSHFQPLDVHKTLEKVALLIPDVDLPVTPDATVADAGRLSAMYGRYIGQITARIDRAWLRPRTPIGASSFSCQVAVNQDAVGNVMQTVLEQCDGDTRWQLSLVQAIQSASPLPAPPDPDVFSRTLHLAFTAEAYSPNRSPDEYEPEAVARIVQDAQAARTADIALQHFADSQGSRAIGLTIKGDRKTVEFQNTASRANESDIASQR